MLSKPVVLWGFMGSGKTTIGQELAKRLSWSFTDTDELIQQRKGKTIPEIFAQEGEPTFRRWEAEILQEVLKEGRQVIAVGGGAPANPDNLHRLKNSAFNVYLFVAPEVLYERLTAVTDRPLLMGSSDRYGTIVTLLKSRSPYYQTADLMLVCGRRSPEDIADQIADWVRALNDEDRVITIPLDSRSHPVVIGERVLGRAGSLFKAQRLFGPFALIEDGAVSELFGGTLEESLAPLGRVIRQSIKSGEESKTPQEAIRLWSWLAKEGLGRDATIVAVGGGACGDLSAFVAATFLRGVALVQVPTTLLAMVDSAIGGKAAVDLPEGKNLVGAFHQPRLILSDLTTLQSLPPRSYRAGLAEVVKYGMIADPDLLQYLFQHSDAVGNQSTRALSSLVARCVAIKGSIVAADEKEESGVRMILNYGHTFGHALEAATGFSLLHGEAIALGMMAEAYLSWRLGLCRRSVVEAQYDLLTLLGLPTHIAQLSVPPPDFQTLNDFFRRDKKKKGDQVRLVLLTDIGHPFLFSDPIDHSLLSEAWSFILSGK
ncbi:MAG: 3-dehydroquinate synthase [Armatimonadetes bacterium]|nr:3-dehydroquinate synthase [Armatimonadota bacterium]MDW8122089.1 3-dehydroquinate synthase [Armatimonadota bacterium]